MIIARSLLKLENVERQVLSTSMPARYSKNYSARKRPISHQIKRYMLLNTDNNIYILTCPPNPDYGNMYRFLSPLRLPGSNTAGAAGELLVRTAACEKLKTGNSRLNFTKGPHGKPYLEGHPDFCFNVSHSLNTCAVAFGSTPVGIDIEYLRKVNLNISRRFFTDEERRLIATDEDFFIIWTKKESYIKYTGDGLSKPLTSFSTAGIKSIKSFRKGDLFISLCSSDAGEFRLNFLKEDDLKKAVQILEKHEKM